MQAKTIHAEADEVRTVSNIWAAQIEQRGTTLASSAWEVTGGLSLGAESLDDDTASALVTITGCGTVTNTVTLASGEVLSVWRKVQA